jgi:hypothetical protein
VSTAAMGFTASFDRRWERSIPSPPYALGV